MSALKHVDGPVLTHTDLWACIGPPLQKCLPALLGSDDAAPARGD